VAATSAAHSRHLIWVMMAYGLSPAGGVSWIVTSWRALQAKCSHLDHRPSAGLLIAGVTGTPSQTGTSQMPDCDSLPWRRGR
jgi:hypothetical protein